MRKFETADRLRELMAEKNWKQDEYFSLIG